MELYLDSVNLAEIKEANRLGYLTGLTTTPTFMVRDGIKDIDKAMLELSSLVDVLQVEALGDNAEEIIAEAKRLVSMGLPKDKTVFKIPISLEGTRACRSLVNDGYMVNLHLVYTLQQAYMAFRAGATYVCPLVGRLQDQGHDALGLVMDCIDVVEKYGYESKIMFSSVRHAEHVKNALQIGVHTCTIPWKVMKKLTENHFTTIGTDQFIQDTNLLTKTVSSVVRTDNVHIDASSSVMDAVLQMSKSKLGAVIVMNGGDQIHRIFTDGDIRRLLETSSGKDFDQVTLSSLDPNSPRTVDNSDTLMDAKGVFKDSQVDCLVVTEGNTPVGLIDVQDLF